MPIEIRVVTRAEVGFGMTGTGRTGATTFDGLKRAGQNTVDALYRTPAGTNRILLADFDSSISSDNNFGSASRLPLEAMIAPGDSGGGLFEVIGGYSYLTGITSFGWGRLDGNPDSDYGDAGGWTRVSSFNSWIDSVLSGTTTSGGGGGKPPGKGSAFDMQETAVNVPAPATLGPYRDRLGRTRIQQAQASVISAAHAQTPLRRNLPFERTATSGRMSPLTSGSYTAV
jgi:hypothetical protein